VVGGHAFYVFNSNKLNLVYMSRYINEEITDVQVSEDGIVFTTLLETNSIQAWNKMHRVRTYKPIVDGLSPKILQTIVTKSFIFCLCKEGQMTIFNTQTTEVVKQLSLKMKFTGMIHPLTYLNKLVFWDQKQIVLHNVIEDEVIFQFKPFESPIETIVQTPVLNVVAVGCRDGSIILLNLLFDEVLLTFKQK
jgi:U3 small nucleolar RNA-associated protein 21